MDGACGEKASVRIASIDIGTNTVLLLIADIDERGFILPIHHEQRLPRLGKDVDRNRRIHISAFDRISWIITEYKNLARQHRAERIVACATSAVRDASNRDEFLSFLESTTGISVQVLSGEDEALWTFRGVVSGFPDIANPSAVLDIGGGSTEISYSNPNEHNGNLRVNRYSLQAGSVRLTEKFFKHEPPLPAEIESARQYILEELSQVHNPGFGNYRLLGVAGTVTTLACMDQRLEEFDIEKVAGYRMDQQRVAAWLTRLSRMGSHEIRSLSNTTDGRADILTAGVLILNEIMDLFRFPSLTVSERGLRYGLALKEWERVMQK